MGLAGTELRETTINRHLAAFETALLGVVVSTLTFGTFTGSLAVSGAAATAFDEALGLRTFLDGKRGKSGSHYSLSPFGATLALSSSGVLRPRRTMVLL